MSFRICWQCLTRASSQPAAIKSTNALRQCAPIRASTVAFTTSASLQINPPKKQKPSAKPVQIVRGVKKTFTKKKKKVEGVPRNRRPDIGERKALRKRIVLSNTNALEVQGMQDISVQSIVDERLRGHVLGIPGPVVDQLRAVEAFKVSQGWPLFRKPAVLVRKETIDYGRMVEEITLETNKNSIRRVMVGERGSGKTLMLLQAMTMAFLKGWVVINIPEAQDLILGHTEYGPLPSTNPTLYTQRMYTANLLSAISRANPILKTLQFNQTTTNKSNTNIQVPIPQNISLAELAQLGASNPETAWPIFEVLLADLKAPNRPPLMLCMDGLAHAMHKTHYIDGKEYKPIHAHQFILIKSFLDHLSGASPLPNGGMVLAATSESNNPSIPSLKLALAQLEGSQEVKKDPFKKYDERVLGVFDKGGVQVQRMGGITRQEARGLMEYWARSGVLKQRIDEDLVAEKWVIAGGGVIGELERGCVRMKV